MARYLWRKQNLATFRIAEYAQNRSSAIRSEKLPRNSFELIPLGKVDPAEHQKMLQAADDQARQELGDVYELVEFGPAATFDGLEKDLAIQERLDGMIDKCLKRLLFLRGLKSLSQTSSSPSQQRITGPKRAA